MKGSSKRETTRFDAEPAEAKKDLDDITEVTRDEEAETAAKKKFKRIGHAVMDDRHVPTRTEQYDFFANDKFAREREEKPTQEKEENKG